MKRCFAPGAVAVCVVLVFLSGDGIAAESPEYVFDGPPSRRVVESYLARSITMLGLLQGAGDLDDDIRMLSNTGAKFAGRALYMWGGERRLPELLGPAAEAAKRLHEVDPEIILQACAFEIVTRDVTHLDIPARVFEAFGKPATRRTFDYEAMVSDFGSDHWEKGSSIPDIAQEEARLWFYHLATSYIDVGCEAIHFGQVDLMAKNDPERRHWRTLLEKVRDYASRHARRHWVWCDGHVPSGGMVVEGRLLLDFHSFPLRIAEVEGRPMEGVLKVGHVDAIYGRSKGGIAPAGWKCDHLPYLVEFDNWGNSGNGGRSVDPWWIWGYDDIDWFARLDEPARNAWLVYAWDWLAENDPNGYLQMPGIRCLHDPAPGRPPFYYAHRPSDKTPHGGNQEDTIKRIWSLKPR